jgi:hypothetical protein
LNLPAEKHFHGLRRLAMVEAARVSFDNAVTVIERATGQNLSKRQVEARAARAAVDFDAFYARTRDYVETPDADKQVPVLSCDGKGVVMRPKALREATKRKATSTKLKTRLSKGEKTDRKRMALIGAVYGIKPAPRTAADILPQPDDKQRPRPKPRPPTTSGSPPASSTTPPPWSANLRRGPPPRPTAHPDLDRTRGRQQPPDRPDQRRGETPQPVRHHPHRLHPCH